MLICFCVQVFCSDVFDVWRLLAKIHKFLFILFNLLGKKADCTLSMSDEDLLDLMTGKLNPQTVCN